MSTGRLTIYLAILLCAVVIADILLGNIYIPVGEVFSILAGGDAPSTHQYIIMDFRLPRVVTALVTGAGLAVSGLLMQVMFRNPLAGPYVLGISTGASLGVALSVLAGIGFGVSWMNSWFTVFSATAGSFLVFMIVMIASFRVKDSMTLLIFGLMLGSATSGIVAVLQYFSKAEDIQIYLLWTFGSLGGVSWDKIGILVPFVLGGMVIAVFLIKPLNLLLLGESYARSLGLKVKQTRILIIMATCLIAGSITAFCGPIGFIGIAVPHIARILLQSANHRAIVPVSVLLGGIVLVICDVISQLPGSQQVLPINAVTAIFGAPVVIWLLLKKGNLNRTLG